MIAIRRLTKRFSKQTLSEVKVCVWKRDGKEGTMVKWFDLCSVGCEPVLVLDFSHVCPSLCAPYPCVACPPQ